MRLFVLLLILAFSGAARADTIVIPSMSTQNALTAFGSLMGLHVAGWNVKEDYVDDDGIAWLTLCYDGDCFTRMNFNTKGGWVNSRYFIGSRPINEITGTDYKARLEKIADKVESDIRRKSPGYFVFSYPTNGKTRRGPNDDEAELERLRREVSKILANGSDE